MAPRFIVAVRLSPELYSRLEAVAQREHRSLNGQATTYIELGLVVDEGALSSVERAALNDPVVREAVEAARNGDRSQLKPRPA